MTQAPESRVLPQFVDARKMANQGIELHGIVPASKLERLQQATTLADKGIDVNLSFHVDEERHLLVTGDIAAVVNLQCQRCLGDVEFSVVTDVTVAIVAGEEQAKALPGRLDPWLVTDASADLYNLIEEEILLALPMVAYHQNQCLDEDLYSAGEEESGQESKSDNPFSVLEQLKGSPK